MNKKLKWTAVAFVACGLAAWGIYSQMPKPNEELAQADKVGASGKDKKDILNVNAMKIRTGVLDDEISVTGILLPDEEVNLSFETSGLVVDMAFKEGSHVKKGQLLAKVNDRKLQADLKRLQAQMKLANDRVYRQRTLLQHDAVSQEAYEQVRTELETLKADIDVVKAQIDLTELRAPFDGIIGLRQISVGAYASPTTVVSKLTRVVPLKVEFSVPERYVNEVNPGTALNFTVDGSLQEFPATVYAKESAIDVNTHTMTVRALYANPNGRLTPGRYAGIRLKKQEIRDAIAIPAEAVVPEMGKDKVFLYKSGKAQPVEVTLGLRTEARVQVLRGLHVGDTLLTSGTLQLRTDLPVTLDRVD
ncbi:MAG: efflux RND transporter periplasmic adaptor subunit [Paraprevotella sp.]|nr:efflux RND transporter periplasmic adaptor subunit [Paraprevotella sp.]